MNDQRNTLLDDLAKAVAAAEATVPEYVRIVFDRSGRGSKKGAWVDGEAPQRAGQFLLWETGELDAQVLRRADELLVLNEHRLVGTSAELRDALRSFIDSLACVDPRE